METEIISIKTIRYRWILLSGLWLAYFCFGLVSASIAPLIPEISTELAISNTKIGIIMGAWPMVYIISSVPCGILLDRVEARLSILLGLATVAGSALLRGWAQTDIMLFSAVALLGVGGPLISVGAPKLVTKWFAKSDLGLAIGIYSTGPALGIAAGLAIPSAFLMDIVDQQWRGVMFCYAGLLVVVGLIWFVIASHPAARQSVPTTEPREPVSLQALKDILALPQIQIILVIGAGIFFVNHGMNNWLPEILRDRGLSSAQASYWASISMIAGVIGLLIVPRLTNDATRLPVMALIFALILLAILALMSTTPLALQSSLVLLGIARASAAAMVMLVLMSVPGVRSEHHGLLGGTFFVAAEIGGVLGPVTLGVLSDLFGGFDVAIMTSAIVAFTLCILALLLRRFE